MRAAFVRRVAGLVAISALALGCTPRGPQSGLPDPGATVPGAPTGTLEAPPKGRLPRSVAPQSYAIELDVDPSKETFTGTVRIVVSLAEPRRRIFLHGRDIDVRSAVFVRDGKKAPLAVSVVPEGSLLQLEAASVLTPGAGEIEISFEAPFAKSLSGLYRVESGGTHYAFTQMEPLDARRAFPCFDEPSFKVPFSVALVVREGDKAIANARQTGEEPAGPGKKRVRFATTEKLPTYLVAFAVGPLDVVDAPPIPATEVRKRPLPLRGVAVKGKGDKLAFALERHTALLLELERYFGIEYPYDKLDVIAVPDFGSGAMENAGAITYREMLLLVDAKTATEVQRRDVVGVASHELAHQWFGNLVTMQWWDDIWLNEAFATWMGQRAVERVHPEWAVQLETLAWVHDAMEVDSLASARAIRQEIVTDDDVENAFDPLTYSKGGALIAMYERYIGEEPFRAGVRRYLEKHRFGNADANDFLSAVFEKKPELAESFRGFLDKPGVPALRVQPVCAADKPGKLDVTVERFVPRGSGAASAAQFAVPLCARVAGQAAPVCGLVGQGRGASGALEGLGKGCPAWVFPNAAGATYARWTPAPEVVRSLVEKGLSELTPPERVAFFDSIRAGVYAGTLGTADVLAVLPKLANDPVREVAFAPVELLRALREDLAPAADRTKIEQAVIKYYGPVMKKVGWSAKQGEKPDVALTRSAAIEVLAVVGRDAGTRKEAMRRARSWLGIGEPAKPDALDADVRQVALVVAVQDGGKEIWDAVRARLAASDDSLLRRHLLVALGNATTDAEAERARALVFDDVVRKGEVVRFAFTLAGVPEQRSQTWAWVKRDLPRIKARVPEGAHGYVPMLVRSQCDAGLVAEMRATFQPHLATMLGAPRSLDNALEHVAICSAVKSKLAGAK